MVNDLRLGRLPVKHDPRTLHAAQYMTAVSPPPLAVDWQRGVPTWPMYANDRIGDCTIAAAAHMIEEWTFNSSRTEVSVTEQAVISAYSAVTGYNPTTGANDDGAVELDVLNFWRKTGVGGHTIAAYVKLNPANHDQVKQAISMFGAVYIGVNLPSSAQNQTGPDRTWSGGNAAGSWGGHAVPVGKYDSSTLECVTWGATQRMTWQFWDAYVEEAYAVLSSDWLSAGHDPHGFDIAALQADLDAIGRDQPNPTPAPPAPPVPPAPTPPPAPVPPVPPAPTPPPEPSHTLTITLTDPAVIARVTQLARMRHQTVDQFVTQRLSQMH